MVVYYDCRAEWPEHFVLKIPPEQARKIVTLIISLHQNRMIDLILLAKNQIFSNTTSAVDIKLENIVLSSNF